ncbi:MAG: hypothetical protein RL769_636 [Pseudomonadota bacterium]|jgi:type IV secretion system protein VirB2
MKKLENKFNQSLIKKIVLTSVIAGSANIISLSEALASPGVYTTVSTTVSSNTLTEVMCNILRISTGNAGKAFAAFAIISVGIGFFTGKVSWGLMVGVAAGIAAMFGAPQIVSAISGKSASDCA